MNLRENLIVINTEFIYTDKHEIDNKFIEKYINKHKTQHKF